MLVPATSIPTGNELIGSRWTYKKRANKGQVVMPGGGHVPGFLCGIAFAPVCRIQSACMVLALAVKNNLEC
ncbi:unnamed protein product [Sphacelaria rigidula]